LNENGYLVSCRETTPNKPINYAPSAPDAAKLRRLLRRYIHTKPIALLFLSAICTGVFAADCAEFSPSKHQAVTITPDSDPLSTMYHVRAPREVGGVELKLLILSATAVGVEEGNQISLPLAIKTRGDLTGSYFHMPGNWLNVGVTASYGEELCTELVGELGE
jgi:hypothetical protein